MNSMCSHHYVPYTVHKAMCTGCGLKTPWIDVARRANKRANRAIAALRDAARAVRPFRRHGDQLRRLLATLSDFNKPNRNIIRQSSA